MRILFSTGDPAHYLNPPSLADERIDCGPLWCDREIAGYVASLATPMGEYDLPAVARRLPADQALDAVICWADPALINRPRGLAAFSCPRVLLVAETSPTPAALTGLLQYAASEPFDRIVLVHDRRLLGIFHAAGLKNLYWFPGLTVNRSEAELVRAREPEREPKAAFAGTMDFCHPRQLEWLSALSARDVPLSLIKPGEGRPDFYGSALIGLHASAQGEIGDHAFDILASGAMLLTDRLAPESGLADLWRGGRECVTYGSPEELVERAQYFLAHPEEARAIGAAGARWFDTHCNLERHRTMFCELVLEGKVAPEFALPSTPTMFGSLFPENAENTSLTNAKAFRAKELLEQGEYQQSLVFAQAALSENPQNLDALFIMADFAAEVGNRSMQEKILMSIRALAPADPRLRELDQPPTAVRLAKLPDRLLRAGQMLFAQKQWSEVIVRISRVLQTNPQQAEAHFLVGSAHLRLGEEEKAIEALRRATRFDPANGTYWYALGRTLRRHGELLEAVSALQHAVDRNPAEPLWLLALGEAALAADQPSLAGGALEEVVRFQPKNHIAARLLEQARASGQPSVVITAIPERDLLITMPETSRRHGTGILIQRSFPDSRSFVTLRSQSYYDGIEEFGSANLLLKSVGLTLAERRRRLRRLLAPYSIRRILCVPFLAEDFQNAMMARELTGAPLCTYVMDDQCAYSKKVSESLARQAFEASDLRLTISAEMNEAYTAKFGLTFHPFPPIVVSEEGCVPNAWDPAVIPANRCILVGNVWSANQLKLLRRFARTTELRIDWYGNAKNLNLGVTQADLEKDGIFCQGLVPEAELARQLAKYPFVLVPSGTLDGTEDNEWLSRLSLPSRMVFILTKTRSPMLVLGSPETCAARFVTKFELGLSSTYDPSECRGKVKRMVNSKFRDGFVENARRVTPAFVFPNSGDWIWRSLAAREAQSAPFSELFKAEVLQSTET